MFKKSKYIITLQLHVKYTNFGSISCCSLEHPLALIDITSKIALFPIFQIAHKIAAKMKEKSGNFLAKAYMLDNLLII